ADVQAEAKKKELALETAKAKAAGAIANKGANAVKEPKKPVPAADEKVAAAKLAHDQQRIQDARARQAEMQRKEKEAKVAAAKEQASKEDNVAKGSENSPQGKVPGGNVRDVSKPTTKAKPTVDPVAAPPTSKAKKDPDAKPAAKKPVEPNRQQPSKRLEGDMGKRPEAQG
ncbi:MAG: hypothetical protein KDB61_07580, partial [Planctomycetes bacterium]|nr:hypothetical protein [Planctomycetota bacterium]